MKTLAYASTTRPNHLWSAAQFNSADPKNRTECDTPLVSRADAEAALAAKDAEIARLRNSVPARALTDCNLAAEISAVDEVIDGGFGEGGGSPGEWWYERAEELEHERKRRDLERKVREHGASKPAGGRDASA